MNKYIDSTLLKPATYKDIERLCEDAIKYDFASVCILPCYVAFAKKLLEGSDVKVCTVIGFPLGGHIGDVKLYEAIRAQKDGADELDMVVNQQDFLNGEYDKIISEINVIKDTTNLTLKVIIETSLLTHEQITKMCDIINKSHADFIKTSTGFVGEGAKVEHVSLMSSLMQDGKKVKASGGIRTRSDAQKFISAGATRIGTSNAVAIMEDAGI